MDSLDRKLRSEGIGAEKHSAEPFTIDDENKFWSLGEMGMNTPVSLLRAVFYYNGKIFCLRGGEEHRNLKVSQFRRTEKGYTYTETSSKNCQGGMSQLKLKKNALRLWKIRKLETAATANYWMHISVNCSKKPKPRIIL